MSRAAIKVGKEWRCPSILMDWLNVCTELRMQMGLLIFLFVFHDINSHDRHQIRLGGRTSVRSFGQTTVSSNLHPNDRRKQCPHRQVCFVKGKYFSFNYSIILACSAKRTPRIKFSRPLPTSLVHHSPLNKSAPRVPGFIQFSINAMSHHWQRS